MKFFSRFFLVFLFMVVISVFSPAEEGMWPIHEIGRLDLAKLGFQVTAERIFKPGQVSLTDAIVNLSGGTGSFVSADGLIITNHHVAFSAIQRASSVSADYLRNGFLAKTHADEVPAKGYTVRIIESCRDVSAEILSSLNRRMAFAARTQAIEKKMKEIILKTEAENKGKRAEVAEMFPGKTYMLFLYTYLKDVRLVYAPPQAIGNFGGETDNWVWPRHTGDFTFLRAYAAPDGTSADFSPANVPYHPRSYLKVASQGLKEGDRVFILGYPGRTYRHRTASYLAFEENLRMPYVADLNDWQIQEMERLAQGDKALVIQFAARIKGLANTMKNYRSKLTGLKRLHWVAQKETEEKRLIAFIEADPARRKQTGDIIPATAAIYREMTEQFPREIILEQLPRVVNLVQIANTVVEAAHELQKKDVDRESAYMDRNFDKTKERLLLTLKNFHPILDARFLTEMVKRSRVLSGTLRIEPLAALGEGGSAAVEKMVAATRLTDPKAIEALLKQTPEELTQSSDPFIKLALGMFPLYRSLKETQERRKGQLDPLAARLSEVRKEWLKTDFIPDANGTLRMTFGTIRGYSPRDAVYHQPFTTIRGVLEKESASPEFEVPELLKERYAAREFGPFLHSGLQDVPVAMLYDMDTTGGNSGSPVFNARGELVGVNFDRAQEATINDFVWSTDFSRSIAVDIRYVLWVTRYIGGAENLLNELDI